MKVNLCALILIIGILFSGCALLPSGDEEYLYSIDSDKYIYCGDVAVNLFEGQDTLEIDVDADDKEDDWRWLLEGSIKRFVYLDGILIIEYYDKWYTFDVENYELENMRFDLKEYETVDQLIEIYPDLESFKWKYGRYERTDKGVMINGYHTDYKVTTLCYKDTVPEYENIGEN